MKYLFLLLFTILTYPQGVKISALAEAQNITQDDLFVIVDSPGGTPVTKKITFTKVLDSIKASTLGYIILQDPFTREMDDESDRIYIPKFGNPYFAWQTDFNSGMDKIDSAVKYFDPVYFEVNGDTVTASSQWNLIPDSVTSVVDSVYNSAITASTSSSIYRAIERAKALKLSLTGGTLTGTLTGTTINATTGFTLNGTSINTTGTLTNVAYKGQDNNFTSTQTIAGSILFSNSGTVRYILGTTSSGSDDGAIAFAPNGGSLSASRGAYLVLGGANRATNAGNVYLTTANVTGAKLEIAQKGSVRILIDDPDNIDVTGNIIASGTVTSSQFKLSALNTAPANASATGTTGEIRIVDGFIYICTATNTWKRVAIATW